MSSQNTLTLKAPHQGNFKFTGHMIVHVKHLLCLIATVLPGYLRIECYFVCMHQDINCGLHTYEFAELTDENHI